MLPAPFQRTSDLFGGLSQLRRELDQFFDIAGSEWPSPFRSLGLLEGTWSPLVDVYEDENNVRVRAELPGLKKDDFEVSIQGDTLILRGERKRELKAEEASYSRVERIYGQFHRAITLPASVKAEEAKATFQDGILELTLPKKEESKRKKIRIEMK